MRGIIRKMVQAKPYSYVRYTWWNYHDLDKLSQKLKESFTVVQHHMPKDRHEIRPVSYPRDELSVKADTLSARLGAYRALLFQRESAPFTVRDIELRRIVLTLYPHSRSTPLPWFLSWEPKFETEEALRNKQKRSKSEG